VSLRRKRRRRGRRKRWIPVNCNNCGLFVVIVPPGGCIRAIRTS